MSKHKLSIAIAESITIKLSTNENVEHIDISQRLSLQFRKDTLSKIQVHKWLNLLKNGCKVGETTQSSTE